MKEISTIIISLILFFNLFITITKSSASISIDQNEKEKEKEKKILSESEIQISNQKKFNPNLDSLNFLEEKTQEINKNDNENDEKSDKDLSFDEILNKKG